MSMENSEKKGQHFGIRLIPKPKKCFCNVNIKTGILSMAFAAIIIHVVCILFLTIQILKWKSLYENQGRGNVSITSEEDLDQQHNFYEVFFVRVSASSTSFTHIITLAILIAGVSKKDFTKLKTFLVIEPILFYFEIFMKIYYLVLSNDIAFVDGGVLYTAIFLLIVYIFLFHYLLIIVYNYLISERIKPKIEISNNKTTEKETSTESIGDGNSVKLKELD